MNNTKNPNTLIRGQYINNNWPYFKEISTDWKKLIRYLGKSQLSKTNSKILKNIKNSLNYLYKKEKIKIPNTSSILNIFKKELQYNQTEILKIEENYKREIEKIKKDQKKSEFSLFLDEKFNEMVLKNVKLEEIKESYEKLALELGVKVNISVNRDEKADDTCTIEIKEEKGGKISVEGKINWVGTYKGEIFKEELFDRELFKIFLEKQRGLYFVKFEKMIDYSTWLLNEEGFFHKSQELLKKYWKWLLFSLDLNHLKLINDTYSHGEGDFYIKETWKILKNIFSLYEEAVISHPHGDEFFILLKQNLKKSDITKIEKEIKKNSKK